MSYDDFQQFENSSNQTILQKIKPPYSALKSTSHVVIYLKWQFYKVFTCIYMYKT